MVISKCEIFGVNETLRSLANLPNNFELTPTLSWAGIYEKNNFKIALGTKLSSGGQKTSPNSSQIDISNPILVYDEPNNTNLNIFSQVNFSSTY